MPRRTGPAAFHGEDAIAHRDAGLGFDGLNAEKGPQVKFMSGRLTMPGNEVEKERMANVTRLWLVKAIDRKEGAPRDADMIADLKQRFEGTEQLKLTAARAVIPCAVERPHVRFCGGVRAGGSVAAWSWRRRATAAH